MKNTAEETFKTWAAKKMLQPATNAEQRYINGRRPNAAQITREQAIVRSITTAQA